MWQARAAELEKLKADLAAANGERSKLGEQLKSLRAKVVSMQESSSALEERAAAEAQRHQNKVSVLQKKLTTTEAELAESLNREQQISWRVDSLAKELAEARAAAAQAAAQPAAAAPAAQPLKPASRQPAAPLSNSNFAKMMGMQQEINQLKSHIETLTAGGARRR